MTNEASTTARPTRRSAVLWIATGAALTAAMGVGGVATGWVDIGPADAAAEPTSPPAETVAQRTRETTAATTTTVAPSTTTATSRPPSTTRTTKPENFDQSALVVLEEIASDNATELVAALLDLLEPFPLERVDILSAGIDPARLIVAGQSGYYGDERQLESTVEALAILAQVWGLDPFDKVEAVSIDLDFTVDGRHWIVPHDAMVDVLHRRLTPVDALLAGQRIDTPGAANESDEYTVVVTAITTLPPAPAPQVHCAPGEMEIRSDGVTVGCAPQPVTQPLVQLPTPQSSYSFEYENCDAARAAGAAPVYAGEPGYGRHLDRDGDGIGCE